MSECGGIDLGGTKIEAVIVNSGSEVLASARHPTPQTGGPPAVAAELDQTLREAASEATLEPSELVGVGVGSPGVVDPRTGAVSTAVKKGVHVGWFVAPPPSSSSHCGGPSRFKTRVGHTA